MLQGLVLTCVGMGTVFLFLSLLVLVTTISSSLIRKYEEKNPPKNSQ